MMESKKFKNTHFIINSPICGLQAQSQEKYIQIIYLCYLFHNGGFQNILRFLKDFQPQLVNLLSVNPKKWSNTLKQFVGTIFWGWRLKGQIYKNHEKKA